MHTLRLMNYYVKGQSNTFVKRQVAIFNAESFDSLVSYALTIVSYQEIRNGDRFICKARLEVIHGFSVCWGRSVLCV